MYAILTEEKQDILMISTGNSRALIEELIASIDTNVGGVKVLLLLVFQGEEATPPQARNFSLHWENVGCQLSLSAARNRGLARMQKYGYQASHVMFPDDDTVFTEAFFEQFPQLIEPGIAYLCRRLSLEDKRDYKAYPAANLYGQKEALLPYVVSDGLILPQEVVEEVGKFDERLGVGAPWGSSEDVDYYLRCTKHLSFHFIRELYTLHPGRFAKYQRMSQAKIWKRFKSYSDGYYFVMYKFGLQHRLRWLPWRALGGAALSALKANINLSILYLRLFAYRRALQQSLARQYRKNPQFFEVHDKS